MLGDNIFYGAGLHPPSPFLEHRRGSRLRLPRCRTPTAYGVVEFDADGKALSLEEKPVAPRSHYAVPGLYFYDNDVEASKVAGAVASGELEITDLNRSTWKRVGSRFRCFPRLCVAGHGHLR